MPKALNIQPIDGATVRTIARLKAAGQGKPAKLASLQADPMFKGWKVGQQLDFYDDLCKYNVKVADIIKLMAESVVLTREQNTMLRAAVGAVTHELRKSLKQDAYATKDGQGKLNASVSAGDDALRVVEKDGKIVAYEYVLTRDR